MKKHKLYTAIMLGTLVLGAPLISGAQEDDPTLIEGPSLSTGEQKVAANIANDFDALAGDQADSLVQSLRNGTDLSYEVEVEQGVVDEQGNPVYEQAVNDDGSLQFEADGVTPVYVQATNDDGSLQIDENGDPVFVQQTEIITQDVVVENLNGPMGFGEVKLSLGLTEALLGEGANLDGIIGALYSPDGTGVLDKRAAGMGWGEIFADYDLSVGEVMRSVNAKAEKSGPQTERSAMAQTERGNKPEQAGGPNNRQQKLEKPRVDKPQKVSRPEVAERPEKPARPDKPERPEKPERPDKPERPERPDRPEKPEKPERPGRA